MSLKSVVFALLILSSDVFSQHIDGNDDGFFQNCVLELMDLTFTNNMTDRLEIAIVRRGNKLFKRFPIKNALNILKDPEFNISRKTMMFAHGYGDVPDSNRHPILKAYLLKPDYNVLLLNSIEMLGDLVYMRSARAVRYVGIRAGNVLAHMSRAGFNIDTFDLVGHSLGAHVAGFMGKAFYKSIGKKLPRIIALDPAGPCFRHAGTKDRVDKSDAAFVQVIHTNGGGYGLVSAIGHVDFYVNGGRWQPSEYRLFCLVLCSHSRPIYLWQAAVAAPVGTGFIGVECASVDLADKSNCYANSGEQRTALMGPRADPQINGIFYIRTSSNYPFYLGKYGTRPLKRKT